MIQFDRAFGQMSDMFFQFKCMCAHWFFTCKIGTEKVVTKRLNSSIHVHSLLLQKTWISLWELKSQTYVNDFIGQMIILESIINPDTGLKRISLSVITFSLKWEDIEFSLYKLGPPNLQPIFASTQAVIFNWDKIEIK